MNSQAAADIVELSIKEDPETLQKISILKLFIILGILFTLPLGILSLFQDNIILSFSLLFISALLLVNYYFIFNSKMYTFASTLLVYLFFFLFLYLVYSGGVENTGSLWIYIFPGLALFLHGLKHGLIDISVFLFIITLMFFLNNGSYLEASYTDEYKIRLILIFAMITLFTSLYEYSSTNSFKKMRLLTNKLIDVGKEDQLSKLTNKRSIYEEVELLFHYAKENKQTLVVMLCDIDYLHDINGRYGSDVREMDIKEISQEIQNSIKNSDAVAWWSGEEFIVLFPQTNLSDAHKYSIALKKRIKNLKIIHDRKPIQVTLTTGASNIENANSVYSAVRQADSKMYNA